MKKRTLIPHLMALALVTMLAFLSCASPNQKDEGSEANSETALEDGSAAKTAEGASAPADNPSAATEAPKDTATGTDNAELNDLATSTDSAPKDGAPPAGDKAAADKAPTENPEAANAAKDDLGNLDALGMTEESGKAPADANAATAGNAASTDPLTPPAGTEGAAAATGAVATAEAGAPAVDEMGMPIEPKKEDAAKPDTQATATTPEEALPKVPADMELKGESKPKRHRRGAMSVARVPKIPAGAVKRKGTWLNRFYFLRAGDTPQSVSELLYGTADRKKDLTAWNGKRFVPGKLVYYQSPTAADDKEMRSFYQERNVAPEEVTVGEGETLSKIAATRLGSPKSWTEIAVINGLSTRKVDPGQKLAVYPANLSSYAASAPPEAKEPPPQPVVQTPPPAPVKAPVPAPVTPQAEASAPDVSAQPPVDVPPPQGKRPSKKGGYNLDVAKLVEQNLFFIIIGAGVTVLLLALMVVNKKRSSRRDEFGDDGFASPTKLKRK